MTSTSTAAKALELRLAGASEEQIADHLNLPDVDAVRREMSDALAACPDVDAPEALYLELARLDRLHMAVWPQATKGNLGAVDRVMKISEQRMRLLTALQRVGTRLPPVLMGEARAVPPSCLFASSSK